MADERQLQHSSNDQKIFLHRVSLAKDPGFVNI